MSLWSEIWFLLGKEVKLEWRQRHALSGILLYVLSTVFIVFISFQQISPQLWNVLFWIIMLFASINAVVKSFVQESGNRQLYYYQLANPLAILLSKTLYNILLLLLLGGLNAAALLLVAGNPLEDPGLFVLAVVLGSIGFSVTFTFIAAIAAKTSNSSTMMTILGFPVIIPVLLVLVNLSAHSIGLLQGSMIRDDIIMLAGIDLLLLGLGLVLFPMLWRE
ncbi:MAG: ABC transporter permease [Saprospirales bacterium]|nr:ABC transporter permease [Saprospirales bacterium]